MPDYSQPTLRRATYIELYDADGRVIWDSIANRVHWFGTVCSYRIFDRHHRWICAGPITDDRGDPEDPEPSVLRLNTCTLHPGWVVRCEMNVHLDGAVQHVVFP